MPYLNIALGLIGLARAILKYLASLKSADAIRARIILTSMESIDAKIQAAAQASDAALIELDAHGVSDDTHFRD